MELLWQKLNLRSSDAQIVSPGTNATGVLRLSQADNDIDHTTYFKDGIFNGLTWRGSDLEKAYADFELIVNGTSYGERRLKISHKDSRVANQGNVTTTLHWGNFSDTITSLNVIGQNLYLYESDEDADKFIIKIK